MLFNSYIYFLGPTLIIHRPLNVTKVGLGSRVFLQCGVFPNPSVKFGYQWLKDGRRVTTDSRRKIYLYNNKNFTLEINPVQLSDFGEYQCIVDTHYQRLRGPDVSVKTNLTMKGK